MTKAERLLWNALRSALPDQHWRKQVPFGPYIADFCSHAAKLIIEADGGQHAKPGDRDDARTRFLESEGYRVIRFWNNEVLGNIDGVIADVSQAVMQGR
jgi:very-short-patch-repair endonuclease